MKRRFWGLVGVATVLLAACTVSPAEPATVTVTETAEADTQSAEPEPTPNEDSVSEQPTAADTGSGATDAAEETFTMPAVVGQNLQDAQDLLQTMDSYLMDQQDATGLERLAIDDSNWTVCAQDPAPGAVVPISTVVTLAAVKLDETCP